jgi:hypothetical protein
MNSGSLGSARQIRFLPPKALVSLKEFALKFTASLLCRKPDHRKVTYVTALESLIRRQFVFFSLTGDKLAPLERKTAFITY